MNTCKNFQPKYKICQKCSSMTSFTFVTLNLHYTELSQYQIPRIYNHIQTPAATSFPPTTTHPCNQFSCILHNRLSENPKSSQTGVQASPVKSTWLPTQW